MTHEKETPAAPEPEMKRQTARPDSATGTPEQQEAAREKQKRQKVLEDFILAFLPAVPSRHRNLANEVHHVATTLSRVMLQHFGFRVGLEELLQTFARLRYCIFSRNGTWDPKKRKLCSDSPPDLFGPLTDGNDGYATTPAGNRAKRDTETTEYLHVNVNPHVVRALRLTTIPLPPNTNEQKRKTVEELHRRITDMRRQL